MKLLLESMLFAVVPLTNSTLIEMHPVVGVALGERVEKMGNRSVDDAGFMRPRLRGFNCLLPASAAFELRLMALSSVASPLRGWEFEVELVPSPQSAVS